MATGVSGSTWTAAADHAGLGYSSFCEDVNVPGLDGGARTALAPTPRQKAATFRNVQVSHVHLFGILEINALDWPPNRKKLFLILCRFTKTKIDHGGLKKNITINVKIFLMYTIGHKNPEGNEEIKCLPFIDPC